MSFIDLNLSHPVVKANETTTGRLIAMGARFIMDGATIADGRFSLVEHPIIPRGLAAPMHLHTREDEYSFILEGRWGFKLGDDVVYGEPGDLVYKPRNVWHSFWNASDGPARLLEVISPSGFEHYFEGFSEIFGKYGLDRPDLLAKLNEEFGFHIDFDSVEQLVQEHGLVPAADPATTF